MIGTLLALGARRGAVVRHYLWYGAVVAAVAALAGVLVGGAATSAYTNAYAAILGLPDTVIEHRIPTAVIGFVLGLAAGMIGGLAPAIGAARTAPAEAMRGTRPPDSDRSADAAVRPVDAHARRGTDGATFPDAQPTPHCRHHDRLRAGAGSDPRLGRHAH